MIQQMVCVVAIALLATACTTPKAWERGRLADPAMAFDPDPLLAAQRDHTYLSKEQASGGAAVGGGGCGCAN